MENNFTKGIIVGILVTVIIGSLILFIKRENDRKSASTLYGYRQNMKSKVQRFHKGLRKWNNSGNENSSNCPYGDKEDFGGNGYRYNQQKY